MSTQPRNHRFLSAPWVARFGVGLGLAAIAVGISVVSLGPTQSKAQELPTALPAPVQTGLAESANFSPELWVPASVISRRDSRVASLVAGRVKVISELGTRVQAGEVLAQLDDRELELRATEQDATVRAAEARFQMSESQLERLTALGVNRGVAASQLDQVRGERDVARQELRQARAQRAQVAHRRAESQIRAPFSGIIAEQLVQVGEFVGEGIAVVRLVDTVGVDVAAQAPVHLADQLQPGLEVRLRLGGVVHSGKVRAVVPVGDQRSRQIEVRITPAPGLAGMAELAVGSALEVALQSGEARPAIGVPRDALVLRAEHSYVYRVNAQNVVERLQVKTGGALGELIAVEGPLQAGDRLVVRGAERLSDGQSVVEAELAAATL